MSGLVLETGSFTSRISWQDRKRLREIVRRVHLKHLPGHLITNRECDALIDAWGPQIAERVIRQAVHAQQRSA